MSWRGGILVRFEGYTVYDSNIDFLDDSESDDSESDDSESDDKETIERKAERKD